MQLLQQQQKKIHGEREQKYMDLVTKIGGIHGSQRTWGLKIHSEASRLGFI